MRYEQLLLRERKILEQRGLSLRRTQNLIQVRASFSTVYQGTVDEVSHWLRFGGIGLLTQDLEYHHIDNRQQAVKYGKLKRM